MRDENVSFDLSFFLFLRTSENARTSERSRKRETKSLLFSKNRRKNSKESLCFKEEQKVSLFRSKKIQKKQQTNFFYNRQTERKQRKNSKKKKSVGKELDTSLCCAIDLVTALT